MPGKANNKIQQTTKTGNSKNSASGKKSASDQQTVSKKTPKKGNTKAESVERNRDTDQE
jgi:hypothetical protein